MQDLQDKTIKELAKDCRTVDDVHEMLKNKFALRATKLNLG